MIRARTLFTLLLLAALGACASDLAVPTEPLRLLRPEWSVAYVGEAFEGALRPAGGLRPYRFELADGELPPGLDLVAGRLVGTPTVVGRYSFTTLVQDGNLSQAILRVDLDVRDLPTPLLRIEAPATEARGALPLTVRVEDARGWRGARLTIAWDPDLFELSAGPTAGDGRIVVFHDAGAGRLRIDAAALGPSRQGAFTLARFTLRPLDAPARLSLDLTSTTRYAGGDHSDTRLEGAPRPLSGPGPGAGDPLRGETPADADADGEAAAPIDAAPDEDDEVDERDIEESP